MPRDTRLNRIMPALSARERAVAAVAAWKEGQREDPWLRRALPREQSYEFGRLIELVRGVNGRLAWLIVVYQEEVRAHWMLLGWIGALKAWGHNASILSHACLVQHVELVTESEAEARIAEARAQTLTIQEAAEYLAERAAIADEALDEDETKFEAEVRRQERRLRAAVKAGELVAERECLSVGPLWDWLGEESRVYPEWGSRLTVVPDDRADDVAWQRQWSERMREALHAAPIAFAESQELQEESSQANRSGEILVLRLKTMAASTWRDVRALSLCINEVEGLLGDDPLHPQYREGLDALVSEAEALLTAIQDLVGDVDIEEPGEDDLAELRDVLERAARD